MTSTTDDHLREIRNCLMDIAEVGSDIADRIDDLLKQLEDGSAGLLPVLERMADAGERAFANKPTAGGVPKLRENAPPGVGVLPKGGNRPRQDTVRRDHGGRTPPPPPPKAR